MRIGLVLAAVAAAAVLPMSVHAASDHGAGAGRPAAEPLRLVADPASPLVGMPVTISVEGAASAQATTLRFHTPGPHVVQVDAGRGGSTQVLSLTVNVRPRPDATAVPSPPSQTASEPRPRAVSDQPRARIAGDPGVTIVDFQFNPGSITIHTGDTITWTNNGSQPHTATANDHSFDTGVLQKGQSGSHTFSQAGTFTYFCTIHPFMHGTINVVGSGSSGGGSGSGASSSGSGTSSSGSGAGSGGTSGSGSSGSGQLPFTGFNLVAAALCGVLLISAGGLLRLWVRRDGQRRQAET